MPNPTVATTLPMPAVAARKTRPRVYDPGAPATLPFPASRPAAGTRKVSHACLLEEATDLARLFGCEIRRRCLGGAGGGCRWTRGAMQIVLDVESPHRDRLAIVADALRGDDRLAWTEMSTELAEYLRPLRAA
ncbi:hypothetical protein MalM25_37040 [Planctomycetes bacterium MalM25]|nr:hypothetical protein MalM25_37040 [Planctomycetes bacterium MalM25]